MRNAIDAGVHRPGEMLPSLRALAINIKVNPNTVQRAYDALEREGVVETRRGVGIFVAKAATARRNSAEQKLQTQLDRTIRQAAKSGLKPDAIRLAFEESMRDFLAEARR
jgi:DNA-binding transcriptional regulator YhcF (GntR family)